MKLSIPYRYTALVSMVALWVCVALSADMFALMTFGMFWGKDAGTVWPLYVAAPIGMALHLAGVAGSMATRRFGWWFFALSLAGAVVLGAHGLALFRDLANVSVFAGGARSDFTVFRLVYRHLMPMFTAGLLAWRLYARAHAESQEMAREVSRRAQELRDERGARDARIFRD